mmetsp:Transcript_9370/g.38442  ORF Transcript_9370/g.38442 Transcript_9370/m.38442 type:complete len:226 (+) Transcript_9370:857-1534(+)
MRRAAGHCVVPEGRVRLALMRGGRHAVRRRADAPFPRIVGVDRVPPIAAAAAALAGPVPGAGAADGRVLTNDVERGERQAPLAEGGRRDRRARHQRGHLSPITEAAEQAEFGALPCARAAARRRARRRVRRRACLRAVWRRVLRRGGRVAVVVHELQALGSGGALEHERARPCRHHEAHARALEDDLRAREERHGVVPLPAQHRRRRLAGAQRAAVDRDAATAAL